MKKLLSKYIRLLIPHFILVKLFPSKFKKNIFNKFIIVEDQIAKKAIKLFLREDSFMEKVIYKHGLYGDWEKESLKIWAELSKKAQTIIDIGANTGIYSILAQNNNSSAKIIAIEPVDLNYGILSKNIKKNKFPILSEKIALSDQEGTAKMFMLKDRLNYMTSINDNRYDLHPEIKGNKEVVEIEVPIKPFSFVYKKHDLNKIDLIKIDVEGHEITVLNSMLPYLEKYKPAIIIEIIGDENAEILNDMFNKLRYEFIRIDEVNKSKKVDRLWDNDHHNFLICCKETVSYLQSMDLVE
jgi:FkbM family methyltransferase